MRPRLDAYAQAWRDGHQDACRATQRGGQPEAALDLRMRCLDRRLREFDGLVKLERPAEAMPYLERAGSIWTRDGGAENPMLAYTLTSLGEAKRQLGRTDEALVDVERAHALRPKTAAPDGLARTKLALARTLETTDLARARGYATQIDPAKLTEVALRGAVEAWLKRHAE